MSLIRDALGFFTDSANWTGSRGILSRGWAHVWVSLVSTIFAVMLAAPAAVWLAHRRRFPVLSVAVANIGRAVPSFAVVVLVYPISVWLGFGLGFWPTAVALIALGIPPIFTNSYAAVTQVSAESVDAARGVGMTDRQVLTRVEVPAAMPLILGGVRTAAVQIVATATLGAFVGYQCLGSFVLEGVAQPTRARGKLIGGALLVALLAIATEVAISRLSRRFTVWQHRNVSAG